MIIENGNLENVGWFIGNNADKNSLLFSEKCQIKWAKHPKGLKKVSGVELSESMRTVVVLISGKWLTRFPNESKEVIKVRCPSCKTLNDEDAKYCKKCGAQL